MSAASGSGSGPVRRETALKGREPVAEVLVRESQGLDGQLQQIFDALPFYVMLVDSEHTIQLANRAVTEHLGVSAHEIIGKYCPAFVHGVDHYPGCPVEDAIAGGPTEKTHYAQELGRWMWTTAYPTGVKTKSGLELYLHMVRDVTDQIQAQEDLALSERKFRLLFEALEDIAFVMSPEGHIRDINRSGLELLQIVSKHELRHFNLFEQVARLDDGWGSFKESLQKTGRVDGHEATFRRADGQVRTVSISAHIVNDDSTESGMVRGIMRDLTRSRELEQLSTTDELTSLYNRGYFLSRLTGQVRRAQTGESSDVSVLFMDIDNFKSYNDSYGHPEGDYVLKRVAESIKLALRDDDVAARYGGEEFAVILACSRRKALDIAERVRASIEANCSKVADPRIQRNVTVSVGLSTLKPGVRDAEELVSVADVRMYAAKQRGKNRVCCGD
jgi:diguanylate cyclase (GGDEF)-like protein/PAS domain S-box-containing protein